MRIAGRANAAAALRQVPALALAGLAVSQHSWHVGVSMAVLGGSNAFFLAPATLLIGVQGMNSRPPALGGAYALFIFAYAAGLALGPLLAGAGTDLAGFMVAMCVLAALVLILGAANAARLPNGLQPRRKLGLVSKSYRDALADS